MNDSTLEVRVEQSGSVSVRPVTGSVADHCRAMGLAVGDTIEGTESGRGWWNTTRLTLLWMGETEAMWRVTYRSNRYPNWTSPREAANWTLTARDWVRVDASMMQGEA